MRRKMSQNEVKKEGEIDGASTSEDHSHELLPGILNDITLNVIAPMLSWRYLFRLVPASSVWRKAIQDHRVYDARVRSHKTQKSFVVLISRFVRELARHTLREDKFWLYFPSERRPWYELPPIVGFGKAILSYSQSVSLNGSLYVLGVTKDALDETGSSKVFKLDLARLPTKWTQCASMQELRIGFALGVMDRKIFAFGGVSDGRTTGRCEVYDPEVDAWSRIEPMTSRTGFFPRSPQVIAVGKELFVYRFIQIGDRVQSRGHAMDYLGDYNSDERSDDKEIRRVYLSEFGNELNNLGQLDEGIERKKIWDGVKDAPFVRAYDPEKKTWRLVHRLEMASFDPVRLQEPTYSFTTGDDTFATAWTMCL